MNITEIKEIVLDYFNQHDLAIEKLSQKYEDNLVKLPSYLYKNKNITIFYTDSLNGFSIEAIPNNDLNENQVDLKKVNGNAIKSSASGVEITSNIDLDTLPLGFSMQHGDIMGYGPDETINSLPIFHVEGFNLIISKSILNTYFSYENAKINAYNIWNNTVNSLPLKLSFFENIKKIFDVFDTIIKKKSFIEHRIHRYLNKNASILMPAYKNIFYEYKIRDDTDTVIADFIIEREFGMPAMLIELENPSVKIYRKNGELTAEANHAENQIAEWVRFIDENPINNPDMTFLKGPKQRLVIMGRGLEYVGEMQNSRHTDTIIWSYTVLRNEAAKRWNNIIKQQCDIIGISKVNLIQIMEK
ncbi:MAG: DUF4263 domain-containing protein [Candidatus Edwardsbacteria bacterium]|nr:DUF4263 domain-containing protein [Candidatus Edwardsbacteria bacterium]